ncbi:hypothetical protein COLO4_19437 [Corchorus olitorius]|uniref:Uncharacterized protein n=1 Tax=Corchorus olitorius TaxID=93759 RepID=A0A1R3J5D5_9ROSI|nr:hypothetical protein COLO4_19437 [Corchorus olitorius]
MKQEDDDDELEIVQEIERSSSAPQKFRLKELKAATGEVDAPVVPTEKPAFMWPPAMAPFAAIREEMDNATAGGQLSTTMEFSGR